MHAFVDGLNFMHSPFLIFAGTSMFNRFRQRLPMVLKCFMIVQFLLLLLLPVVVAMQLCYLHSHDTELVVVGQTTSHESGRYWDQFFGRETITMTADKNVDNECLKVTVFSIDRSDEHIVDCTTTSENYTNGHNQTLNGRRPVPLGYLNNPRSIRDGGMIELTARIFVPKGGFLKGNHITIYYFKSHESTIDFLYHNGSDETAVFWYDLKKCINQSCHVEYPVHLTVPDSSFFFFVVSSNVEVDVDAQFDFIFHSTCYDNHYYDDTVKEAVNITVNESGSISIHPSRRVLQYPYPLKKDAQGTCERLIGHVGYTANLDPAKPMPLGLDFGVLALNVTCFLVICLYLVWIFRHKICARNGRQRDVDENAPLINNINPA